MTERLQKVLARAGYGSRRQLEQLIREGRIQVNGETAELGQSVGADDKVRIDGKPVSIKEATTGQHRARVLIYHKPVGELTTRDDPEGRPTIFGSLPELKTGRWVTVGRLDMNTSGLLLVTTDGELANRLMHPSSELEREYAVRVLGEVSPEVLKNLQQGVALDDGPAHFETIQDAGGKGANHWYHVTLKEGRNREVRRLWESQGVQVSRLMRVRYGPIELPRRIKPGRWEELTGAALKMLYKAVDLPPPPPPANRARRPGKAPRAARRR